MTREANHLGLITTKHIIEQRRAPLILGLARLSLDARPQPILLAEALLEPDSRERGRDVPARMPAVARVDTDPLSQFLLDERAELVPPRQRQVAPLVLGGLQAAGQGGDVEARGRGDAFFGQEAGPVVPRAEGLRGARGEQRGVEPGRRAVAVGLRVVAVPVRGGVEGLGAVVDALAVSGEEEEFVGYGTGRGAVQVREVVIEELPLRGVVDGGRGDRVGSV